MFDSYQTKASRIRPIKSEIEYHDLTRGTLYSDEARAPSLPLFNRCGADGQPQRPTWWSCLARKSSTYANQKKCSSRQIHNLNHRDSESCDKCRNTYTVYWYCNSRSSQKGWDGYKYIIIGRIVQRYASTVETMCHWRSYHTAGYGEPWRNPPDHIVYMCNVDGFNMLYLDWIGHPLKVQLFQHQLFQHCVLRDTLSLASTSSTSSVGAYVAFDRYTNTVVTTVRNRETTL